MAGKKRYAVILVSTVTVLAAAGVGVYQLGGTWWGHESSGAADLGVAVQPLGQPTTSDLGAAAARAWAGEQPAQATPTPVAVQPVTDDRYEATTTGDAAVKNPFEAHSADYTAPQPVTPVTPDDRYALPTAAASVDVPAADRPPVARGQSPSEGVASSTTSADEAFAAELGEINPLRPAAASTNNATSSRRARDAFQASPQPVSNDRYNASLSEPSSYRDDPATSQPMVNPFVAQATAASPASTTVQPLQPASLPAEPSGLQPLGQASSPDTAYAPPSNRAARGTGYDTASSSHQTDYSSQRRTALPLTSTPRDSGSSRLSYGNDASVTTIDGTGRPGERAMEGPQRPALEIQKFAPAEIQVGKPAKFTVKVRNIGARQAEDVTVRDEVPQGTRLVSTNPRADNDSNHLVWQLGTLSAGEERTIEVQVMPTAEGEIGSVATVSFATQASVKTRCTMPQLAIRMTAPGEVMIGHDQHVKIELHNPGTGDATGVMLYENVPQELRHAAGNALEFEIGTLHAGETRQLELVMTAEKAGQVTNILSARADGNIQVEQQVAFEVVAPDLQVSVDGPSRRYLERQATYQVNVENPGTAAAKDIELVTKLPKGMRFVSANNLGEYDPTTHAVYWSLAELPQGERGSVELVAMPVQSGDQTLEVEGRAQQGLEDHTAQQVLVEGLAAIMFEVRDAVDPIEVGGETEYEIRVVNQGTKAATNVQVVVGLPPGMKATAADGETRYAIQAGGVVFEPIGQLAPKADSLFRVHVQGVRPGDQRVTVQVNSDDFDQPIRREESTRVFGDQ